jgi:hypothetical protein
MPSAKCAAAILLLIALSRAAAADWPEGYEVYKDTQSPDGRYGILVPTYELWDNDSTLEEKNYFADLKSHRSLGKIAGADYFSGQNHRSLITVWAKDSNWCVVQYDSRFGFDTISIIEPKGATFVQTDIGKKIDKALTAVIARQSHEKADSGGDASPYFRIINRTLEVRVVSTTDPKQLNLEHANFALFYGTFDLNSKKWLSATARPVSFDEYDMSDSAFGDIETDLEQNSFANDEDKLSWLDERMNGVYTIARLMLPAGRFATVKQEQINWLKQRDAATSIQQKSDLLIARIKVLQELVW